MATVKKTNSNYIIQTPRDVVSNITLDTDNVYVTGNLYIEGNTTTISSENLTITDNVIVLNEGQPGAGITKGNAGIIIDRGTAPYAQLQYSQTAGNVWQITSNASAGWANILSTENAGLQAVVDDPAPVLGGNLNVNGFVLYANISVNFSGNLGFINTTTIPTTLGAANTTLLYTSTPASGQSGIYVINSTVSNQELVTKTRAVGFSLIL
jgi:hypothetical protein